MTSNIGQASLNKLAKSFGFEASTGKAPEALDPEHVKHQVMLKLREQMRPEFLNRIDKILIFNPLTRADLKKIVKLELGKLKKRLAEQKISLVFLPAVANYLTEISFDPKEGARLVRKNLQDLFEDQIAQSILRGEIKEDKTLTCKVVQAGKQKSIEIT
jgi:ATP-dependent Clp protease ATP-binding subunit ClpB